MVPPQPLRQADLSRVAWVLTDVDGTLTTQGTIRSSTMAALESLRRHRVGTVLVTGRPAGWAECWARSLPVQGVVAENGGLYFARTVSGRLVKRYAEPPGVRERNRARLERLVARVLEAEPRARLSMDSRYTEVDLAIDHSEQARLGRQGAVRLEWALRRLGVTAVRSSVHINCWLGSFDKLSTTKRLLGRWGERVDARVDRFVYVGDSLNDAPMFEAFSLSVGVANVAEVLGEIEAAPAYVTRLREGAGFEELAARVLAARKKG